MLRRILSIVSVVFLLCMLPAPALAEQKMPVTVRTGYLKEDTLYTFSHFSQEAFPSPSGDFLVGTTNFLVGNGIGPDKSTPVLSAIFLS